jgi:hypothetical protein
MYLTYWRLFDILEMGQAIRLARVVTARVSGLFLIMSVHQILIK